MSRLFCKVTVQVYIACALHQHLVHAGISDGGPSSWLLGTDWSDTGRGVVSTALPPTQPRYHIRPELIGDGTSFVVLHVTSQVTRQVTSSKTIEIRKCPWRLSYILDQLSFPCWDVTRRDNLVCSLYLKTAGVWVHERKRENLSTCLCVCVCARKLASPEKWRKCKKEKQKGQWHKQLDGQVKKRTHWPRRAKQQPRTRCTRRIKTTGTRWTRTRWIKRKTRTLWTRVRTNRRTRCTRVRMSEEQQELYGIIRKRIKNPRD